MPFLGALALGASTFAATWTEPFEGEKLSDRWQVDRSPESKGGLRLENGCLIIKAEEGRYHHVERELAVADGPAPIDGTVVMDGTDRAPLRVDCQITAGHFRGLPTVLALYWGQRNVIAVGPVAEGWRDQKANSWWVVPKENGPKENEGSWKSAGVSQDGFRLGQARTPAYFRIVVTTRAVTAQASRDGVHYAIVVSLERRPGQFAGAPERVILGRGWFGDDPAKALPDLDNDHRAYRKDLFSFVFHDLRVTNDEPRTPLGPPPGYEARDTWDETIESYSISRPVEKWMLLGPLPRKKKGDYGPEKGVDLKRTFDLSGGKKGTWVPHQGGGRARSADDKLAGVGVDDNTNTSGTLNFRHALRVKDRYAACFAYARIHAREPRRETFHFNGERWISLYVNNRWMGSGDSYRRRFVPDLLKVTVGLSKGVNHILVRAVSDRGNLRFALKHGPADPVARIQLLRQLIADFPHETDEDVRDETERGLSARFEIARLWEAGGCLRKAIEVLGEVLGYERPGFATRRPADSRKPAEIGGAGRTAEPLVTEATLELPVVPQHAAGTPRGLVGLADMGQARVRKAARQADIAAVHAERARLFRLLKDDSAVAEELHALARKLPAGSPERTEATVQALAAGLRAGRDRSVENELHTLELGGLEHRGRWSPERLRRLHAVLAGVYEELGKRDARLSHLKQVLKYGEGSPRAPTFLDALLVEYAEALLEPVRQVAAVHDNLPLVMRADLSVSKQGDRPAPSGGPNRARGPRGAGGGLRTFEAEIWEALGSYRRAIYIAAGGRRSSSPLSQTLREQAVATIDRATRTGKLRRALGVLPALYVRACLARSEAGASVLQKLSEREVPRQPEVGGRERLEDLAGAKMVKGWHVVGPFDNTNWKAYRERTVDAVMVNDRVNVGRPVRGKSWQVPQDKLYERGYLDLKALLKTDDSVAFLYKEIWADEPLDTKLLAGCDDGLTFWFNGKKIYEDRVQRAVEPDSIVLPVKFKKGVNRILAMVQEGHGDWGFVLRVSRLPGIIPELGKLLRRLERFSRENGERHSDLAGEFLNLAKELGKDEYALAKAIAETVTRAFPDRPDVQLGAAMHFAALGADKNRDLRGAEEFVTWGLDFLARRPVSCLTTGDRARRRMDLRGRGVKIARALGDFDSAAARLRALVTSSAHFTPMAARGDRAVRALLELGDLYRMAGYLDLGVRYYEDALERSTGDVGVRLEAYEKVGRTRTVRRYQRAALPMFDVAFDAGGMLRTADRAAARRDLKRAVRGYQRAVDRFARTLFRFDASKLVGVAEYAADRIRALGAEGIRAYRESFDSQAESLYKKALARLPHQRHRRVALKLMRRVAEEYPCSSFGDDALNHLGNLHLDSGHAARAAEAFGRIIADHPDTNLDLALLHAKYAFALEMSGQTSGEFRRACGVLDVLAREFGSSTITVAGRKWRAATYAGERLKRLRAVSGAQRGQQFQRHDVAVSGRTAASSGRPPQAGKTQSLPAGGGVPTDRALDSLTIGPVRYEVRFPVGPVERVSAPQVVPLAARGGYHSIPTSGVVEFTTGSGAIYFHTMDEAFAVDLGTGELRWRSGLFFEELRRGTSPSRFGGQPATVTAVEAGRVYVRALRRSLGPSGGGFLKSTRNLMASSTAFVIEARDCRDGALLWSTGARADLEGLSAVSSPTVAGGTVFITLVGDESNWLHAAALDSRTGDLLWRQRLVAGFAGLSFTDQRNVYLGDHGGAPTVADGDVYVATDRGAVIALERATGRVRWTRQYPRAILDPERSQRVRAKLISRAAGRVVVGPRSLYVAPRDAMGLVCIRRADGDMVWHRDLVNCQGLLGLVGSGSRLLVQGSGVTCLDSGTGAVEWRWHPSGRPSGPASGPTVGSYDRPYGLAALGGDVVYVPTASGIHRLRLRPLRSSGMKSQRFSYRGQGRPQVEFSSWKEMGVDAPVGNLVLVLESRPPTVRLVAGSPAAALLTSAPLERAVLRKDAIVGFDHGRLVVMDVVMDVMDSGKGPSATAGSSAARLSSPKSNVIRIPELTVTARVQSVEHFAIATAGLPPAELSAPLFTKWHLDGGPGRVYVPTGAGPHELYLGLGESVARIELDPAGGRDRIVWRTPVPPGVRAIAFSDELAVLVYDGHITALDRGAGGPLWTHHRQLSRVRASPEVVVGQRPRTDNVYIIDARTGYLVRRHRLARGARYAMPAGRDLPGELLVVMGTGGKLWLESFDFRSGARAWRHDFKIGESRRLRFTAPKGGAMYLCDKGGLVRFDVVGHNGARKEVWTAPVKVLEDAHLRSEGGYVVYTGRRGKKVWRTVAVDSRKGEVVLEVDRPSRRSSTRGQYRFTPGGAIRVDGDGRYVTARLELPGGAPAWESTGGRHDDNLFRGVFAGRYWVQPYERKGRLRCRLIDLEHGGAEGDERVPGSVRMSVRDVDPGFVYRDGLLIYGTEEGVTALGGLPPAAGGTHPVEAAVRRVRETAVSRPAREREGSSEFLAAYARRGYSVFLASGRHAPSILVDADGIIIDGRSDDWQRHGIKAMKIADPIQLRSEPAGGTWEGPKDLSALARLAWDRRYVYVSVEVTDDAFVAPAPGADPSTGDSVIVGFDTEANSPDVSAGPDSDDMVLQMALVGGRSRLVQLYGRDVDAAGEGEGRPAVRVSRTKQGLFYELALPWGALRSAADERPGKKPRMRFGVAVVDWDGTRPDGALEWGHGLIRGLRPRLFGDISFVDFSPERVAQYRRFIDVLPSHTLSWRFVKRLAAARAGEGGDEGRSGVYEDFVRTRPTSSLTPWALSELVRLYRKINHAATQETIVAEVAALARRAGVPARAVGDAVGPGEHSGGLGRAIRQWVYLDPEKTPSEIMLQFETDKARWNRRCFWGWNVIRWGRSGTEQRWPMGELPPAGEWVQLTVPVAAIKLGGHSVKEIDFAVNAGRAYWDLTEYVVDGDVKVLLDDELAKGARFRGNGAGRWVDSPVKSGRRAHTNGNTGKHYSAREYHTAASFKVDLSPDRARQPTKADLEKYVEAARILPDTEEAITLLHQAEAMYDGLERSKRAEAVAEMYADFLRTSPETPLAHRILTVVRRTLQRASVQDAVARCERIMDEIRLSRTQRRLFYGRYATGIPQWQILGYFDTGGHEEGIEKALRPERFPVDLISMYKNADGRKIGWREAENEKGIIDFRAHLGAAPGGSKWPVAYLYARLGSPRHQKVSLTIKVGGKGDARCAAWWNGKRAGPVVSGGRRGDVFAIPVTMKKGVNDVLLKVSEKDSLAWVAVRVADLNGRPLFPGDARLVPRPPLRLVGVLAYERADRTRLFFSRPVDPISAGSASNYRIDGTGLNGATVGSARVEADGKTVVLTTSELSPETTYTIVVGNVTDTMTPPNSVEPGTRMRFSRTVRGMGVGLKGEYFDDEKFTELKLTRIDPTVNFDWGDGSPDAAVAADTFSVRWTGRIEPQASGRHAFHTVTDDGVRLWIDGAKVIDNWTLHSATEDTGEIELEAGRLYTIKMEFYEGPGQAVVKLLWTDPVGGKQVVPTSQLYP